MQFKRSLPIDIQRPVFQLKPLENERTLTEFDISDNSTFQFELKQGCGKLVIRLRSTTGQPISNINVHLHLDKV
ncbi:unnamed protein product [Rotaria sp. Silwood2]|nr:unnamed protein product [Rotaria sp. Silwood2]CAF4216635.1 unnamed protein product [Rotaria sp. Silwood2]